MSYDLGLYYDAEPAQVNAHEEGGTYALGGTTVAELNITYNYWPWFTRHLDSEQGIRWLYGKRAHQTVDRLKYAIEMLGTDRNLDYWAATPGNAGYALSTLLRWAEEHPKAVWVGD